MAVKLFYTAQPWRDGTEAKFPRYQRARKKVVSTRSKKTRTQSLASIVDGIQLRLILMAKLNLLQPTRGNRTSVMLFGSLLFHGALVGTAALWVQPREYHPLPPLTEVSLGSIDMPADVPPLGTGVTVLPPILEAPSPSEPLPSPPEDAPSPNDEQEITEPQAVQPVTPPISKRVISIRSNTPPASSRPMQSGVSAQGLTSGKKGASLAGLGAGSRGWHIPKPAYTFALRGQRLQGVAKVRVATGSNGRVTEAVIVKSTGSTALDENTLSSIRSNWSGPANASTIREVEYKLQ